MSWAWFEKLPFVGSYMTIFRQIYDYLYAIVVLTKWTFTREFFLPPHVELNLNDCSAFNGKTAVLTGGTRGIGAEIVKKLLQINVNIIIGCRNLKDGEKLVNSIRQQGVKTGTATFLNLDLMSLASVRKFAKDILASNKPIHLLINNAGIMGQPFKETQDGFESHFQVNFLSHFLLINLLLPKIIKTATECRQTGRIINVNAAAMYYARLDLDDLQLRKRYNPFIAYFNSKLMQVLMTRELDSALQNAGVTNVRINDVHPGVVATELVAHTPGFDWMKGTMEKILMTPAQGADDVLYPALSPDTEKFGGKFFVHQKICLRQSPYYTYKIQTKIWKDACALTDCNAKPDFSSM